MFHRWFSHDCDTKINTNIVGQLGVLKSHGPGNPGLKSSRILYAVTFLIVFSALTRVTAFLIPDYYLSHLGSSPLLLSIEIIL